MGLVLPDVVEAVADADEVEFEEEVPVAVAVEAVGLWADAELGLAADVFGLLVVDVEVVAGFVSTGMLLTSVVISSSWMSTTLPCPATCCCSWRVKGTVC